MEALLLINNDDIPASNRASFERRDPLTDELVTHAAAATLQDAKAAADAAAAAFPAWAAVKPTDGHAAINEFTELRWITIETEPHHYPF
jgi:acyl-CoA reductase-like NAD-dependent aldehyde dehydrogenase